MAKRKGEPEKSAPKTDAARKTALLSMMMHYKMRGTDGVSFKRLSKDLNFMDRTTSWRNSWSSLFEQGYVEALVAGAALYTTDHRLTQVAIDHAATDEFKEFQKEVASPAATEEEHQDRIKKKLMNKRGVQIFEFLLKYGSLTRKELAGLVGANDRGHSFSYALQQLRKKFGGKKTKKRAAEDEPLNGEDEPATKIKSKTKSKKKTKKDAPSEASNVEEEEEEAEDNEMAQNEVAIKVEELTPDAIKSEE